MTECDLIVSKIEQLLRDKLVEINYAREKLELLRAMADAYQITLDVIGRLEVKK